jgi:hypothetical protein
MLSGTPGFSLRLIWTISASAVVIQLASSLLLLRREFRRRLNFSKEERGMVLQSLDAET